MLAAIMDNLMYVVFFMLGAAAGMAYAVWNDRPVKIEMPVDDPMYPPQRPAPLTSRPSPFAPPKARREWIRDKADKAALKPPPPTPPEAKTSRGFLPPNNWSKS